VVRVLTLICYIAGRWNIFHKIMVIFTLLHSNLKLQTIWMLIFFRIKDSFKVYLKICYILFPVIYLYDKEGMVILVWK